MKLKLYSSISFIQLCLLASLLTVNIGQEADAGYVQEAKAKSTTTSFKTSVSESPSANDLIKIQKCLRKLNTTGNIEVRPAPKNTGTSIIIITVVGTYPTDDLKNCTSNLEFKHEGVPLFY